MNYILYRMLPWTYGIIWSLSKCLELHQKSFIWTKEMISKNGLYEIFTYKMQSLWKQIIVKFGNNTATLCLKPFLTHVAGWPGPEWRQMLFLFRHFVAVWENQAGSNCCVERKSSQQNRENQENGKFTICFMCASAMQKLLQLSINLLLKILKVILVKDQDSANFSSILKMTNL